MAVDPTTARINRIQGQIKAVGRMYENGEDCASIVQQVQAARSALGKVAGILLADEAKRCVQKGNVKELEEVVEKTFKTI